MSVTLVVIIALAIGLAACAQSGGAQVIPGKSDFAPGKPGKMTVAVKGLKNLGRGGDTELVHVNPEEKRMLKKMGGSGTINPKTGLKEFRFGGGGHGASNDSRESDRGGSQRDSGDRRSRGLIGDRKAGLESHKTGGPGQAWDGPGAHKGSDGGATVTIERRKSVVDVAPGDERGGQSQRDGGALLLSVSVQPGEGGELGGGQAGSTRKDRQKQRGRAATLLSGSEGIRDKLGRSGRSGVGKGLG